LIAVPPAEAERRATQTFGGTFRTRRSFAASRLLIMQALRKVTILFVEDDESVREATARVLRQEGFEVIEASTGEEGIERLLDLPPDVLLTDIQLPGTLDGWDVAERCRECQPSIPVVYATGFAGHQQRPVLGSVMLHKPYSRRQLMDALRSLGQVHAVATPVNSSGE
jgi:CheY-like chemotaxis protein